MISTPMQAIAWLKSMDKKQKFGERNFAQCADIVRQLMNQRGDLKEDVEVLKKHIIPKPKKPEPPSEVNGGWDLVNRK